MAVEPQDGAFFSRIDSGVFQIESVIDACQTPQFAAVFKLIHLLTGSRDHASVTRALLNVGTLYMSVVGSLLYRCVVSSGRHTDSPLVKKTGKKSEDLAVRMHRTPPGNIMRERQMHARDVRFVR